MASGRWVKAGTGVAGLLVAAAARMAVAQETGPLVPVARFDHQVTDVAVSEDGRVFVNFPAEPTTRRCRWPG